LRAVHDAPRAGIYLSDYAMGKSYLYNTRAASFLNAPGVDVVYNTDSGDKAGMASASRLGASRQRPLNMRPRFESRASGVPDEAAVGAAGSRTSIAATVEREGRPLRAYRNGRPRFERHPGTVRRPSVVAMPALPRSAELDRLVDRVYVGAEHTGRMTSLAEEVAARAGTRALKFEYGIPRPAMVAGTATSESIGPGTYETMVQRWASPPVRAAEEPGLGGESDRGRGGAGGGGTGGVGPDLGPGSYEVPPPPRVPRASFTSAPRFNPTVEAWQKYYTIQGTDAATRAWTEGHSVGPVWRSSELEERDRRLGHAEHPPTDINPDFLRAASIATRVRQSPLRYAPAFRSRAVRWHERPGDEPVGPGAYDLPPVAPLAGAGVSRVAFTTTRPRGDARLWGDTFNTMGAARSELRISGYTGWPPEPRADAGAGSVAPELSTTSSAAALL
jgi:hypothetical protein